MILEVQILIELRVYFVEVRILKELAREGSDGIRYFRYTPPLFLQESGNH